MTVGDDVAQVVTPRAQLAAAAVGSPIVPAASLQSYIASLRLPLIGGTADRFPPRRHVSCLDDSKFVPRRSDRLAAKSIHRDPNPEKQAKRVLLYKWTRMPPNGSQASAIAAKFYETFVEPLSASKQAAMREMFPMARACKGGVLPMSDLPSGQCWPSSLVTQLVS